MLEINKTKQKFIDIKEISNDRSYMTYKENKKLDLGRYM